MRATLGEALGGPPMRPPQLWQKFVPAGFAAPQVGQPAPVIGPERRAPMVAPQNWQ
jgi:hypothetical protein